MSQKFIKDISASTLQVILNQCFGLVIFYITSTFLTRQAFGELNWTMAVLSVLIILISLGMEQIIIKKIAGNKNEIFAARLFLAHTIISSLVAIIIMLLSKYIFKSFYISHFFFLGISIALIISFNSSPFKQLTNGLEYFKLFAIISISSNFFKAILLISSLIISKITITAVIHIYIISSILEVLISIIIIARLKINFWPLWDKKSFKHIVKDSIPQLGVMLFDSALARMDWILLGIISNQSATAEYSFAYKIYETSRLPLLIIAPVILPKFSRIFLKDIAYGINDQLKLLFRYEMVISFLIPIILNLIWIPLFNYLTNGKYGSNNNVVYMILSISVPLHYIINFLWTQAFVQNQSRIIFLISVYTSLLNIILNLFFIPKAGSIGAAISFSLCTILQVCLYYKLTIRHKLFISLRPFFHCAIISFIIVAVFKMFAIPVWGCFFSMIIYLIILLTIKVIRLNDLKTLKLMFN